MDEVDIDNVEDLNELEARLYAQIHHEATNEANTENNNGLVIDAINKDTLEQNYETSSNTNIILSRRYWANAKTSAKIPQHNSKQRFIRNPFKTPNQQSEHQIKLPFSNKSQIQQTKQQKSKQSENQSNASFIFSKTNEHAMSTQKNSDLQTEKTTPSAMKSTISSDTSEQSTSAKQKVPAVKSNLKLNPVANWMERKKNKNANNVNDKNSKNSTTTNSKQGPFARQQEKLQKAKRIEEKKQKSKKARNTAAAIASKIKPYEIIDLETESESDSSDVIVIPIAPPPTYTVDDSDDEKDKVSIVLGHEENALDSTDVQMCSTSGSFIKPQSIQNADGSEKRLDNSSRCTSPCSIQSSDDFIGQTDRSRLLVGASDMADDEDLLVLTTDINSLLGVPEVPPKQIVHVDVDTCVDKEEISLGQSVDQEPDENMKNNDSIEFVTPETYKAQSQDYRVDQGLFRALDVYESESDITDSVYSKGANKATVIRQIDNSSDELEDISSCSQRTKRLRKRRASSGNKESDPNNENSVSSSDNEDVDRDAFDDNKVLRTAIPFIAKGPAVECYKPKKRRQTIHSSSPHAIKHKSVETPITSGNMSDTKFIATLNNLAQGQEGEQLEQDEGEESENENVPTARDIAEKILAQHNITEETKKSSTEDMAVPEALLDELDKVFETIDQMDKQETNQHRLSSPEDTVKISDSSDSDREKHFIYKSLPNEEAQVIKYSPPSTSKTPEKSHNKNCSPIYNVIYSRGQRKPGGMGWNDEMRKFYNESWNGEYFSMNKILQKMNPDKNLWKIYTEDRFCIKLNKRSNIKCTNCCEFGHIRSRCKKPRKPLICYMCGDSGHHEPRCPNTICLRCGKKTQVFTKSCNVCSFQNRLICPICKIRGHSLDYCPDKWRRYHSTTEANTYPNSNIEYNPRKYCCICGARGHLSDNCRSAVRFLEYPPIVSTVKSHQKSYSDVVVKTPHNGIALNLMYEPCQEFKFCLVAKTSYNKYYGRFLRAVGLDYLLKRKRHISAVASEVSDTTAKKTKRLSKKYEANPYSKIGTANQKNIEADENAPNQVQEITESCSTDQQDENRRIEEDTINIEDNNDDTAGSDNEIELIGSTVGDDDVNIQLNTTNKKTAVAKHHDENFKSPENVKSTTSLKSQTEPPVILDSDSNYSFSEHFDVASTSGELPLPTEVLNVEQHLMNTSESSSRPKPREMEALPDFIPLNNSTEEQNQQNSENEYPDVGISRRFVATISEYDEDEEMKKNRRNLSPLPELPCEAKIYLTHLHSIYLLSPVGNTFLVKTARTHKLKARLDFTSIGHVLVIFGLPRNQDNFQRELLLKFRELEAENNQKHIQSNFNVPKRIDVLIRFLRENINLLLNNLGNVNHLLKRLQFLERQQSKSGYKLAEKVRRSLNMILVGQAGLQDGSMHLDKLLVSLKTLINDYNSKDFTPPELRSEITDHWKVIFSSYRHENYQRLVEAYNRLISKNCMPKLFIDPILLGQKVLDVSLSEEQKQTLEQARTTVASSNLGNTYTDAAKQIVPNPLNQKNTKPLKRKQNVPSTAQDSAKAKTPMSRSHTPTKTLQTETPLTRAENSTTLSNVKAKATINNTSTPLNSNKTSTYTGTLSKTKTISTTIHTVNKLKQSTSTTNTTSTAPTAANANFTKKQPQKLMPPPPFANPENRSNVTTSIQKADQLKSTYDSLLTEISSDKKVLGSGKVRDSKLPSTFWSREAMRYLLECLHLAAAQPSVVEKLKRVENKSKRGQLSYNDYLAVIKLHTALNEK